MRLFGMGMPELIIILLVILIIFGPKNLPKLGSALGKAVKGVREGVDSVTEELGTAKNADAKAATASATVTGTVEPAQVTVVEEEVIATPTQTVAANSETATGTKFCINCGEKLPVESHFCNACGANQDKTV